MGTHYVEDRYDVSTDLNFRTPRLNIPHHDENSNEHGAYGVGHHPAFMKRKWDRCIMKEVSMCGREEGGGRRCVEVLTKGLNECGGNNDTNTTQCVR